MSHRQHYVACINITILLVAVADTRAQEYPYAWIDLPALSQEINLYGGSGLNAAGVLCGSAVVGENFWERRAVVWDTRGRIHVLESLGGNYDGTRNITDRGDLIAGSSIYETGTPGRPRAVIWRRGRISDIGTLGGEKAIPQDMNNREQVVGNSEYDPNLPPGFERAFLWENGEMRALPDLGGDRRGVANGMNNHGDVVGTLRDGRDNTFKAVLWREAREIEILPGLPGSTTHPRTWAINDNRVIVGTARTRNGDWHAVMWIDGEIHDIHTHGLGSDHTYAMHINNRGQIVGTVGPAGDSRAFIREPDDQMRLLDDLVPPRRQRPLIIESGLRINEAGQIATIARREGDPISAWGVLLTPVYPTMEMSPPTPGRAGVVNTIAVTDARPGATVHFLYSRHGGGTRIPNCDLQQNALQLDSPTVIGSTRADANGTAQISAMVPPIAQNQTILIQAVIAPDCAISQLVVHRFE